MSKIKIIVVGSRKRDSEEDLDKLCFTINDIIQNYLCNCKEHWARILYSEIKIITGDCDKGGDRFAREELPKIYNGIEIEVKKIRHPDTNEEMDFNNHPWFDYFKMCKIFYTRNEEIAKEKVDYMIALVTPERRGGTENTIKQFKRYNQIDWESKLILI